MIEPIIYMMMQFQRVSMSVGTTLNSTANQTTYATANFSPAVNDLLVVYVATTQPNINPVYNAVTDSTGEVTFTEITGALQNNGSYTFRVFVASNLCTTTTSRYINVTVTDINHVGYTASGIFVAVTRIAGMTKTGSSAVRQYGGSANVAPSSTPTVSFTNGCLNSSAVLGWIQTLSNPAGMTAPTGWNELQPSIGHSTPTVGLEYAGVNSGFTGNTITWGSSAPSNYSTMGVEIITTNY